jgi:hypothetical protein
VQCMVSCVLRFNVISLVAAAAVQVLQKYKQSLLESYMEDNAKVRFCPSVPWCGRAVEVCGSNITYLHLQDVALQPSDEPDPSTATSSTPVHGLAHHLLVACHLSACSCSHNQCKPHNHHPSSTPMLPDPLLLLLLLRWRGTRTWSLTACAASPSASSVAAPPTPPAPAACGPCGRTRSAATARPRTG